MTQISWTSPIIVMISSTVCGIALSIGHHLFYLSLAGHGTPTGSYSVAGANISKQQLNTAVGTAFAFLVKSSLALAISVAYIQAFWYAAKISNGQILSHLDTMFSVLEDAVGLLKIKVWYRYPILFISASIAWLIPLASVITPATLSVQTVVQTHWEMRQVPQVDFTNLELSYPIPEVMGIMSTAGAQPNYYQYAGPSLELERIAAAVTAQGAISPIQAPAPNSSWSLQFWGPSMACGQAPQNETEQVMANVYQYLQFNSSCKDAAGYIAWSPLDYIYGDLEPFINKTKTWSLQSGIKFTMERVALYLSVLNMSEFATSPSACANGLTYFPGPNDTEAQRQQLQDASLIKCQFYNASYISNFTYVDGAQSVRMSVDPSATPLDTLWRFNAEEESNCTSARHGDACAFLQMPECTASRYDNGSCVLNAPEIRTFSYQSVISSFFNAVSGSLGFPLSYSESDLDAQTGQSGTTSTGALQPNSNIVKAALMDTTELGLVEVNIENGSFAQIIGQSTKYAGITRNQTTGPRGPLASALEEMFANLTVSLMSNELFYPDYSSPFAPNPLTNITFTAPRNIYVYDSSTLWIAYGLALGFTLLVTLAGYTALWANSASYTNSFSTVLRIARAATLSKELTDDDGNGHFPLPDHLENVKVSMRTVRE